ncbi:single-strand-DNA-specific exonuclease [Richelia sinica FACHB-800]|uniref:Single-stranded-DNA-specific exonuclease RecJ n=1 Tax=Richelia sinica FACHB-800 TaxID=1357546 RepID=A0A975T7K7_9NOST|nr:single-stranded-DNA-specific exonuclease RecJ [Richelia sinica]MBD2665256.1 single-stranded-DNA-specific exonuclease RecJ [Richelia sinica FACHB-800]QXE23673.1 single-strand-DNA-specific exonuclease [Richelia sinica FACHB-800]
MQWILATTEEPPHWFIEAAQKYAPSSRGVFAAQLFWQRGIKTESQLAAFINYQSYQPASGFEFGIEMNLAVQRLQQARLNQEKVVIWGDFDADGITSTAVLWDGLGEFFSQHSHLSYYIPNRLKESHGLNQSGIDNLAQQGCKLIVTCDTGSTNIEEIIYAQTVGIDVIVTDHHTLPPERPPVIAIINPRYLSSDHPLFHLSGVAVAYKLVEALYQTFPDIPLHPLSDLWDLVAVGLIADLVQLSGDCRYLAQLGIQQLQADYKQPPEQRRRPGVGRLLELCQKSGDRPTDISFGLGPRINAVSRIQGDARFCVELLTSRDIQRCNQLAEETELANSRRKSLQKDVQTQVSQKVSQLDLSTTTVIVLEDPQWPVGVLGLVAGQVAQETGRPTILLSTEGMESLEDGTLFARGSARSINSVDLYQLVKEQAHLLHRFGGHPYAAGLSLRAENIPLFTAAINQKLRQSLGGTTLTPTVQADLVVTVADLGKDLFLELKLLEPCGMGNPVPKLLIKNCWFENAWHRNQQDLQGKKIQYIKTEFDIRDDGSKSPFPGIWWGHYKDELPIGKCDCIAELDYNSYKKRYEIRLIAVRSSLDSQLGTSRSTEILDWRNQDYAELKTQPSILIVEDCPTSWDDLRPWLRRSLYHHQQLAIAWSSPQNPPPQEIWLNLVGIAKYLHRTQQPVTRLQLLEKLGISDPTLHSGFKALKYLGFTVQRQDRYLQISWNQTQKPEKPPEVAINYFLAAVREEQFQREYFATVPLSVIQTMIAFESVNFR